MLDGRNDYSLASERTRAYWRSWFRGIFEAVVNGLSLIIGRGMSREDIAVSLSSFFKELGNHWLRYLLDLYSTDINNLCRFFDLLPITIIPECGNLSRTQRNEDADTALRGSKPSPGG